MHTQAVVGRALAGAAWRGGGGGRSDSPAPLTSLASTVATSLDELLTQEDHADQEEDHADSGDVPTVVHLPPLRLDDEEQSGMLHGHE